MESNVDIFIENEEGKSFMINCSKEIKYSEVKKIIDNKKITALTYYYVLLNGATYDEDNLNELLKLEEGDKITIVNERQDENGYFIEFHKNYNLNESNMNTEPLTGLLKLRGVRFTSSKYINIKIIIFNSFCITRISIFCHIIIWFTCFAIL